MQRLLYKPLICAIRELIRLDLRRNEKKILRQLPVLNVQRAWKNKSI